MNESKHPIDKWLWLNGLDRKWLAGQLNVQVAKISKVCRGHQKFSNDNAFKIEEITNGAVEVRDLYRFHKTANS